MTLVVLAACNTQAKWTYPVRPGELYRGGREPADVTVAVLPFREERPLTNRGATLFLYLIPLMPFGWMTYERPDSARMFNSIAEYEFQIDEDLAKAAARSLERSGMVEHAYFTFGGDLSEADYRLEGTARSTRYYGTIISYGLSIYGPLLWLFGLPAGTSENRLEIDLSLRDRTGEEVWKTTFSDEDSIVQGLYYNFGNDTLHFAILMEDAMNEALADLEPRLRELEQRAAAPGSPLPPRR